ncbi:MAG: TolC family outer membrane protein [Gammaproteobacteria bacterium]|nr:TolC family outer membrane protein [Gammaproteobacteria bacterium]MDH3482005.1 TolC family outer membrane protein [Gammaproteobacteria bacterium]
MKKLINIRNLIIIIGAIAMPGAAQAASLLEIYQQALQSDPQIHEAEARRLAALEAKPQARGVLLPQLSVGGEWTRSEFDGTSVEIDSDGSLGSLSTTSESEVQRWQFTLRQTLFRWDQIVGLRRADKLVAKAEAQREAAQQDLIVRVAQRYFDVLAAEDRLTSIHADRTAIARQLEQAKQRFEVGLIAITAVQESQAAYDQSVADEIAAKRTLATSREFLREITGEYVSTLSAPGEDFPLIPPDPNDEASWVSLSLSQNLNLIASRLDEQLARDEISFQRNGHYPTIEIVANSGESDTESDRSFNNSPFIPADSDGSSDSVSVQFNLPLFAGGSTSSRVREAVYLHRASREQLQRVTRETERQARDAYLGVISERSRVKALQQAVSSSRTALDATQAGFEVGTRTIVDVLNSQFSLYLAITNYYQSRYDYVLNALRLKQAAGTLGVQDLEQIDQWLTERKPPEQVIAEEEAADAAGY